MLITEPALVADTNQVSCSQLCRVAAALQKQATRDSNRSGRSPRRWTPSIGLRTCPSGTCR